MTIEEFVEFNATLAKFVIEVLLILRLGFIKFSGKLIWVKCKRFDLIMINIHFVFKIYIS